MAPLHDAAVRMVWLALVTGCMTAYRPGTILAAFDHTRLYGCVEVGVELARRPEATGPVLVVHLGNRCDHSVVVDLSALRAIGLTDSDETVPMVPYDPDHEIEPLRIDARDYGDEWIELDRVRDTSSPPRWIDVELGKIIPSARADDDPPIRLYVVSL